MELVLVLGCDRIKILNRMNKNKSIFPEANSFAEGTNL